VARVASPSDGVYSVNTAHSNHHIIPIADLLYLWDYFHHLHEDEKNTIRHKVGKFVEQEKKNRVLNLQKEIEEYYSVGEKDKKWKEGLSSIKFDMIARKKNLGDDFVQNKILNLYVNYHTLLISLSPGGRNDRSWFAWSFWNLFQGWSRDYRTDDPSRNKNGRDFSEQVKPLHFDQQLWGAVKKLFSQIQLLKKQVVPDQQVETNICISLTNLHSLWARQPQQIHQYNENEWQNMGQQGGHFVCRLRSL